MYAFLEGKFELKTPAMVVVNVAGIGFELPISLNTFSDIQSLESGKLYTYLQIKEDAHTLFGFSTLKEKEVFVQLISVSGVGAATARIMLSSLKPEEVIQAISTGNLKLLESIKGIGKKTAERIVVELKDKFGKIAEYKVSLESANHVSGNYFMEDAVFALTTLGIGKNQATLAVEKIIKTEPEINQLEELIKKALKVI